MAAPPKRFAQDAIGADLVDVDRAIGDAALDRLAFLSGQTATQLLDGTLRPDIKTFATERRPRVDEFIDVQRFIYAQIERHAFFCTVGLASPSVADYLAGLAKSGLRGSNPAGIADRVGSVLQEWWRYVGTDRASQRGAVCGRSPTKPAAAARGSDRKPRRPG
jgi:hypothetical protein